MTIRDYAAPHDDAAKVFEIYSAIDSKPLIDALLELRRKVVDQQNKIKFLEETVERLRREVVTLHGGFY